MFSETSILKVKHHCILLLFLKAFLHFAYFPESLPGYLLTFKICGTPNKQDTAGCSLPEFQIWPLKSLS